MDIELNDSQPEHKTGDLLAKMLLVTAVSFFASRLTEFAYDELIVNRRNR